ncbi:MAG: molecular chaperone [Gammaproteobacteria bacterium]|nr:molecular chaperone [Gammaproteobacteria bacterium]
MHNGILYAFFLLFISWTSHAIVMSPSIVEFNVQKDNSAQIVVTNNTTTRLPLEATLLELNFKQDGSFTPKLVVDLDLLVFPPAAILKPGASQVFRIQWVASTTPRQSRSYFVRFSQPPLESNDQSGIALQVHYNALLHVYANNNRANVVLKVGDDGNATLVNSGSKYTYSSLLTFSQHNQMIQDKVGTLFIPPNASIDAPSAVNLPAGEYDGNER